MQDFLCLRAKQRAEDLILVQHPLPVRHAVRARIAARGKIRAVRGRKPYRAALVVKQRP